jgi:hypothetical protein
MDKETNEKQEAKRRKQLLKRYAASMVFVVLITLVQASSLYVAFTWGVLLCALAGVTALGVYIAGLSDLRRHGVNGRLFTVARRWVLIIYLIILATTSYI